ncbi:sugar phosphate isomerase/epimerase [Telmatocola sphagniphila]|uniref:Sugar phosphate isomerase/epimerase n=1 Tax=Telmatocola sphagniphila TaxID=1123043 RepID=A0A8E6B3C6_9BACT|nr:sugar phosphate isomerase/epimerase [Telmatocola sphagniphila]
MKLGICLESLNFSLRQGLPQISRLGVAGVQVDAYGELAPAKLTSTAKREIGNLLRSNNLQLTALNCPLRRGIDVAADQQPRLEYIRQVMDLSFELGPRIVLVQCPRLPSGPDSPQNPLLNEALRDLAAYGDKTGVRVALEAGFDPADKVVEFLNRFDYGSLGINFDPGNFLLHGHNPAQSILPLQHRLVHFQARDVQIHTVSQAADEVPLGHGNVEWMGIIGALSAIEYKGFLTIKRQPGRASLAEMQNSVSFLRKFVL